MTEPTLPTLYRHDRSFRLDDTELEPNTETISNESKAIQEIGAEKQLPDPVVHVDLPLVRWDTTGFRIMHRVHTPRKMQLTSGLLITRDCQAFIR